MDGWMDVCIVHSCCLTYYICMITNQPSDWYNNIGANSSLRNLDGQTCEDLGGGHWFCFDEIGQEPEGRLTRIAHTYYSPPTTCSSPLKIKHPADLPGKHKFEIGSKRKKEKLFKLLASTYQFHEVLVEDDVIFFTAISLALYRMYVISFDTRKSENIFS